MPFNFPATEVYNSTSYRVVWSPEEHASALAEGWSEERVVEPSPELLIEPDAVALPASEPEGEAAPIEIAPRKCGNCGETGHNRATCPNKAA